MAIKNILFKISADVGGLNEQLQELNKRIEELGNTAAKTGKKVEKEISDTKIDSLISQLIAAEERAEKARDNRRRRREAAEQRAAQQQENIINKLIADLMAAEEKAEKDRDNRRRRRVAAEQKAAQQQENIINRMISDLMKAEERAEKDRDNRRRKRIAEEQKAAARIKANEDAARRSSADIISKMASQGGIDFGGIVKGGLAVLGITSAIEAVKEFTLESVRSAAEFQKNQIAFKTFIGSAAEANKVLKDLVQLAIKTPFTSEETIAASRVLAAYGFNANQLVSIVQRLGNIASGTSIPLQQLALVFGQIKAAGKLMGQDLLQLVNAGFNPLQEISERTGESMAQLRKRMGDGKISFDEVAQSIYYATERGGRFYDLNNKLSQTTAGQLDALKEKWQLFTRETGQGLEKYTAQFIEISKLLIDAAKGIVEWDKALLNLISHLPAVEIGLKLVESIIKSVSEFAGFAAEKINKLIEAYDKWRGIVPPAPLPSTIIPQEEEAKQLKTLEERNKQTERNIKLLRDSWKEGKFNMNLMEKINSQLEDGHKIRLENITDQRDFNAELAAAYDQLLKQNDLETKGPMYKAIKKRAEEAITFYENVKKGINEAYNARPAEEKNANAYIKKAGQIKNINEEIERLKALIWDADAKELALITQQGGGRDANNKKIKKEVDLYVELRKLAKQVEDARLTEFRGKDQYTVELVALKKYQTELQRIEDDRQKRIAELNALALQEAQSVNKDAVLSEEKKAEIIKIVDFELYDRRLLAEKAYNKEYLDIQDKFNEQNKKALDEAAQIQIAIEKGKYEEILKTNQEAIDRGEKAMDEAKTRRQFKFAKDATEQLIAQRVFYINQKKNTDLEKSRLKEEADLQDLAMKGLAKPIMMPGVLTALYGTKPGVIGAAPAVTAREAAGAKERADIEQAAKDEIIKIYGSWDNYLKEQHKKRREEIIDGWSNLVSGIKDASQVITDEIIRQTDVLITEQQKRVDKAKEIADKGNAEFLQREEDRLNKLNEKRRKAARVANAIAKTEMVAQAALAVAKAAGQTGAGAPFAIASTLIALAAGVAAAYSSFKFDGYAKGGYTGDGGKYEPAGTVHKGEFVFTKETTKKYRPLFEEIHKGRTPGLIQGFGDKVIVVNNNMNDRLERIEKAILGQNRMQVSIDENGIHGIVSRIDYNNKRLNSRF